MEQQLKQALRDELEMSTAKTKFMSVSGTNVLNIENQEIKNLEGYVYLGHQIELGKENQKAEITRKVSISWAAFGNICFIRKNSDIPINLKRKVHDMCIILGLTHGLDVITLTIKVQIN